MTALTQFISSKFFPPLLGLMASLFVLSHLDVAEECAWTLNGPGLTLDENLNVASGVYVFESIWNAGLSALHPSSLAEIFNSPNYHPDYPPLGRMPLGLSNALLARTAGLGDHQFYMITYARVGSAIIFGLLLGLITAFTRAHAGPVAGIVAGMSLLLTPRIFGHAHLASVETTMNLTYALSVLVCAHLLAGREELKARDGILPGLLLGLALLTKIQAIFLPPVIAIWILWHWRLKGIAPLVVLAVTSAAVFFVGWPWLWSDPVTRFVQYFMQSGERAVLNCFYFGQKYTDRTVPWHYPFVIFLLTTPLPWLLLGGWGMTLSRRLSDAHLNKSTRKPLTIIQLTDRQNHLLLGAFWLPLIVFSIPGVPVYDGERLFLIVWPIFSIWVGVAAAQAFRCMDEKVLPQIQAGIAAIVVLIPLYSLYSMQPAQLSFYDIQAGGLRGAASMGMERDYWGESVTPDFLSAACDAIPEGATIAVAPVLHPLFPQFLKQDSWLLHRPDLTIVPYDDTIPDGPRHVLLFHRQADQWPSLTHRPPSTRVIKQVSRQGVVLAEMLELPDPKTETTQNGFDQARELHRRKTQHARANMIRERSLR